MTFKLAHLSDLHASYKATRRTNAQGVNLREVDGYLALAKCVQEIIEEDCDATVVAGDVFHTPAPSIRAIVFVQNQFRKLAENGVKVYALAGNHDVHDALEDIAASRVLSDEMRGIYAHAEPYVKHEIADGIHLHLVSHHMYSAQSNTFDQIKPVASEINIFSTHGSVIDPLLKEKLHTDQSPREIVIPEFLLTDKDWSYTLLGHIHERGWIGSRDGLSDTMKKKVFYNGSLIRRGFSDKDVPLGRGWTLWEIDNSGNFTATPKKVAQRPQIDFTPIEAENFTAPEITEIIVNNLKKTQISGSEFDQRIAPLIRQKIINISPAKNAALNLATINQNTQHTLQWQISHVQKPSDDNDEKEPGEALSNEEILNSGDIVQIYDDWITKSSVLSTAEDELQETISAQARDFIQLGQEATLESD